MGLLDKFKKKKTDQKAKPVKPGQPDVEKKDQTAPMPEVAPGVRLEADKKSKKPAAKKVKKQDTKNAYRVLIRPIVTEKSSDLGVYNKYVFEVAPRVNKIEVKRAVKDLYGVEPVSVNIMNRLGKFTQYGKTEGYTKNWKKAVITLKEGDKIEIQEGV